MGHIHGAEGHKVGTKTTNDVDNNSQEEIPIQKVYKTFSEANTNKTF